MYNKELFHNKELWKYYDAHNHINNKADLVLNYIPEDVISIIDIGCGNGIITNNLSQKYKVLGVDLFREALKFVRCDTICSSSDKIGINDFSFDMVFSSELLEHLPEEMLKDTISEFKRIARKYIFITVPNKEFLGKNYIKCPKCQYIFHSYGHLNSFSENDILSIIGNDFKHLRTNYFGPLERDYNKFLLEIRQRFGNRWFSANEYTVCPHCGNRKFQKVKGNFISKICNGINLLISGKKHYWLFILFERRK